MLHLSGSGEHVRAFRLSEFGFDQVSRAFHADIDYQGSDDAETDPYCGFSGSPSLHST